MGNSYKVRIFWLFVSSLFFSVAVGQDFGDTWTRDKEGQPFLKIRTAKEGLYKVSYELLVSQGVDSVFFQADKLQLWHRGKQQAISVKASDGTLKAGDYLLFYGIKNDGWQDGLLYSPVTDLYNRYASLYSDTTAYFLTVGEGPNKRTTNLNGSINTSASASSLVSQTAYSFYKFYWHGIQDPESEPSQSHFVPGEGFIGLAGPSRTEVFPLDQYVPGSPFSLEAVLIGWEQKTLWPKFYLQNEKGDRLYLGEAVDSVRENDYGCLKASFSTTADLSSYLNNNNITVYIDAAANSMLALRYLRIDYTKGTDLVSVDKQRFLVPQTSNYSLQNVTGKHWLSIVGRDGIKSWVKDSVSNGTSYLPALEAGDTLFYASVIDSVTSLEAVSFRKYVATDSTYLILTHPILKESVKEYAAYRSSPKGGGYIVMTAYVDEIMDQFNYGEKSPLGIRRFLNHLKHQNIHAPDQFFIIGQGIQLDYLLDNRANPAAEPSIVDFVMTAGVPGSDYVFSLGLDGTEATNGFQHFASYSSSIPTGRLQVRLDQRVREYLSKVKEHESLSLDDAPWRRNLLHLSGGYQFYASAERNKEQAKLIRAYMDGFANLAKLPYWGANVKTIGRVSSEEQLELIDISTEVNNGTSLVTFLGHSGRIISDIWIGLVSDGKLPYNNKGKYPALFLNGCRMGDVYIDFENKFQEPSVILDWLLTPDKGAILCVAGSSASFLTYLNFYIQNHYISSFMDSANVSKSMGEQMVAAQQRYMNTYTKATSPDPYSSAMIGNYNLQGDPAVHLFPNPKAEYSIDCEKASLSALNNRKITTLTDSFDIAIPIRNKGIYTKQSFEISVKRWYANNSQSVLYPPQSFEPVREYDTVYFRVRGPIANAVGSNTFEITIDPSAKVPELDKGNNICSYTAYIPGVTMLCLNPPKFSIVNKQPVTFIAQSSTPTVKEREFYMELDTSYLFNSPFKKSYTTKAFDLPTWQSGLLPDEIPNDSIVYYWRTRYVQPETTEDTAYSYSSFIYIKDSPEGWSQSEYPQFFEDDAQSIKLDSNTGTWNFFKIASKFNVITCGSQFPSADSVAYMSYNENPIIYSRNCYGGGGRDGLYILTINPLNLKIRPTFLGTDGTYQCDAYSSPLVTRINNLGDAKQQDSLYKILTTRVQNGDYVLMMNIGDARFAAFNSQLKALLRESYGASRIDSLGNGHPYILLTRKGMGKISEKTAISPQPEKTVLRLDSVLNSLGYAGQITTPLIGPAAAWGHFIRKYDKNPQDSIRFDIIGVDVLGKETVLLPDVKENYFELKNRINASQYPYLRLFAYKETHTADAPQLLTWQVIMQKSPEGTLLFDDSSSNKYASFALQEGDSSKFVDFKFKNISSQSFQPGLVVRYKITNPGKSLIRFDTLRSALTPDSTWKYKIRIPTMGWVGANTLEIFFNPPLGQKEEYLENNQYKISYNVTGDRTNPILDVAFDGRKIINGEIIPPNPTISIAVNDENKYLIRQDASGMVVELQRPCGQTNCPYEIINLNGGDVTIYPAGGNNKFELRYKPGSLPDGKYSLKVQATDLSGNPSGIKPYTIQFEIVNETTISNFLPYPNPFSSKMRFVYTLTGEVPDQVRVQILTVTGKIVRQIFQDELGPLYIGTHQTDFFWDGTDDYGDQLANGLYLYKVVAKKNGQEFKQRENASVDGMFKDGYGKLYILR